MKPKIRIRIHSIAYGVVYGYVVTGIAGVPMYVMPIGIVEMTGGA